MAPQIRHLIFVAGTHRIGGTFGAIKHELSIAWSCESLAHFSSSRLEWKKNLREDRYGKEK